MRWLGVIGGHVLVSWDYAVAGSSGGGWSPTDGFGGILIAILLMVILISAVNWLFNRKNPDQEKVDSRTWFERFFWFGGRPIETLNSRKKKQKGKEGGKKE